MVVVVILSGGSEEEDDGDTVKVGEIVVVDGHGKEAENFSKGQILQ